MTLAGQVATVQCLLSLTHTVTLRCSSIDDSCREAKIPDWNFGFLECQSESHWLINNTAFFCNNKPRANDDNHGHWINKSFNQQWKSWPWTKVNAFTASQISNRRGTQCLWLVRPATDLETGLNWFVTSAVRNCFVTSAVRTDSTQAIQRNPAQAELIGSTRQTEWN